MQLVESAPASATAPRTTPARWAGHARVQGRRLDPRRFGRLGIESSAKAGVAPPPVTSAASVSSGLQLFAVCFLAGFLFVSILLA